MISSKAFEDKTFEDLMEEAMMQIPLYSKEWTNFNPSDPGITMIENFSAFQLLQQSNINQITDEVQEKLLKLVGFEAQNGKCARVLLETQNVSDGFMLPAGQKFKVGDIGYEINRQTEITGNSIKAVYTKVNQVILNAHSLLHNIGTGIEIFGKMPRVGDAIYLVCEKQPEVGSEVIFFVKTESNSVRNKSNIRVQNEFANITWEVYTERGYEGIKCRDYTGALLFDGELRFRIANNPMVLCDEVPESGYVIKGTLKKAEYDISPRLLSIHGFLLEAWQKENRSICHTFQKNVQIRLYCDLLEEDYVHVFCKENKGESYRLYRSTNNDREEGRLYKKERYGYGIFEFTFDKSKFKYGPAKLKDAVKIVAYSEEMMRQYELGVVYGYDEQEIELPSKNIVSESFSIIAERINASGDKIYDFVKPKQESDGALHYILKETEGKICILEAGDFIDATLFLCNCSVTKGAEGNIRANNIFLPIGYEDSQVIFTNPTSGMGGRFKETLEEVRRRFIQDLNKPYVAVEAKDYERLVQEIPELCIHKVKAMIGQNENEVIVVAKPYANTPLPQLPALYQKAIYQYLENRRLLSTRIKVVQPNYVAIDVRGVIYVKKHYENSKEQIESYLNQNLDYVKGKHNFGELMKFDEIFYGIENLECVELVYELAIYPQNSKYAIMQGMDIKLIDTCLCYPGEYYLDINTYMQ